MKDIVKNIFRSPYVILLVMVLAANWQLVFLKNCLQWDMMDFWLPWRHYMSECYNNGIVPLWNPYTQSGYPVHGDLQGPAYSPEALLISFLFGQNVYVLTYCFIFYLFIASVGMYKLTLFFTSKKNVSVLAGIIYSMSGFNVAHGHYFYLVVNVALIPFIFYYFFKILKAGTYADALKLSLIIFWHVTTGNPSLLIISGYLMIFLFLFYVGWKIKNDLSSEIFAATKKFGLVLGLSILMALPVIYNVMHIIPLTTRKEGLPLAFAGDESFYYQNFLAFVIPLITVRSVSLTGYEQEIWSCYVGVFTILFFILGLKRKWDFFGWSLIFMGMAGLIIAIGVQWPAYPFLHKYFPLFNVFRMPNIAILFFLMFVIITAAKYLSDEKNVEKLFLKKGIWLYSFVTLVALLIMLYIAYKHDKEHSFDLFSNYKGLRQWLYGSGPVKIVLFHILIFLVTIIVLLVAKLTIKSKLKVLCIACSFDVLINYQLGATARVFGQERAIDANEYFSRFPKNFTVPADVAMERVSGITRDWPGYGLNTSIFIKQPDYHSNNNSFELINYHNFLNRTPHLSQNVFKNSYAFFADSLLTEENFIDSNLSSVKTAVSFRKEDFNKLKEHNFTNTKNKFGCTAFFPNHLSFEVNNTSPSIFVIDQNYCPLWKFTVNGKAYKPFAACFETFPAFVLPAGTWKIEAIYSLPSFSGILLFSLSLFTLILFFVIYSTVANSKTKKVILTLLPLLFIYCLVKFWTADVNVTKEKVLKQLNTYVTKEESSKNFIINNTSLLLAGSKLNINLTRNEDVMHLYRILDALKQDQITILNYDRYFNKDAEDIIVASYGKRTNSEFFSDGAKALSFKKEVSHKIISDTLIKWGNTINNKNQFSPAIVIDSVAIGKYKEGDMIILSAEMSASAFDFPGLTLEIHYKDKNVASIYKYQNISTIKGYKRESTGILYRLPKDGPAIKSIVCYVWNPSIENVIVHELALRAYRP